ncbi:unnamed protein product [Prorocentrum cordatum]|uniref:Uncharacterized protein n=1 Tax=Prorocentrum cordatum TaxID=2364126 RepID=A0ABN9USU8_9DINO|nr:unnamed protein product [Polarella glacialis]
MRSPSLPEAALPSVDPTSETAMQGTKPARDGEALQRGLREGSLEGPVAAASTMALLASKVLSGAALLCLASSVKVGDCEFKAMKVAIAGCAVCSQCVLPPNEAPAAARLDALPEALPGAAAGPPVAVATAAVASLAAALAGVVAWRGRRAAPATARSALVAEGQGEDTPIMEGGSAAAPP